MSMYLQFGNYIHDQGECAITISRSSRVENGIVVGYTERWDVQGRLQIVPTGDAVADRAMLSPRIAAMQLAYQQQGVDLGLYFDDGTPSVHYLQSSRSAGGTRVTKPPYFPIGRARVFDVSQLRAFGRSRFSQRRIGLISWTESLVADRRRPAVRLSADAQWSTAKTTSPPADNVQGDAARRSGRTNGLSPCSRPFVAGRRA